MNASDQPQQPQQQLGQCAYIGAERPLIACYANYFEVGHNAFEFLIDVAQIEPQSGEAQPIGRIAINPVHAKLLAALLQDSVEQFEAEFHAIPEVLEPDCDLAILSPQEFEQRARAARSRPATPSNPSGPDPSHDPR